MSGLGQHVFNYTKGVFSLSEFKDGQATLFAVLKDNPTWSDSDVIIGGKPGCYFLINGYNRFMLRNCRDGSRIVMPIDGTVTLCSCGMLLCNSTAMAFNNHGYFYPTDEELEHCPDCHRVWDGCAQCPCYMLSRDTW